MRVILAFCLAVGLACGDVVHAGNLTKQECVDGMKVAVVFDAKSSPQAVHGYQLLGPSGKPLMCGERLKNHMTKIAAKNAIAEAYINQTLTNRKKVK